MKLKPWMVAVATAVVIFGGIALTAVFNLWRTESTKEPARYVSGEFAGQSNPGDIRGSYSFGDVERAFSVPAADLARAFVLTEAEATNAAAFQVKGLEGRIEGVDTDSVRWFVALVKGLPYTPAEDTMLPGPAIGLIRESGTLSAEALASLEERRVAAAAAASYQATPAAATPAAPVASQAAAAGTSAHSATEASDRTIRGSTTFQTVLDWGVSRADLEKLLGGAIGAPGVTVRDFSSQNGIEFSTVRGEIQKLIDAAR